MCCVSCMPLRSMGAVQLAGGSRATPGCATSFRCALCMGPLASSLCKLVQPPTIHTIGLRFLTLRCQGMIDAGKTGKQAALELGICYPSLNQKLKDVGLGLSWPRMKTKYGATAGAQSRRLSCHRHSQNSGHM